MIIVLMMTSLQLFSFPHSDFNHQHGDDDK